MSFFYLNPVRGDLPTHLMETIMSKRIDFLKTFLDKGTMEYNEYMIEGSVYDNVGHFILCIILNLCNTRHTNFFVKAECDLFTKRLEVLTAYDMRSFAKKLLRSIKKYDIVPATIEPLQIISQHLILKNMAHHICEATHNKNCSKYSIKLHFKHCLPLVSKRQVEIVNGIVTLPCGNWKEYLILLFRKSLWQRITKTNLKPLRADPRVSDLINKVTNEKFKFISQNPNCINSKNVHELANKFPPCMLNLHLSLRKKHRLSHQQRFYYSLFLKDIGMPVEEAIEFWKKEYRLNPDGGHACCHNWEKDEKKYLYGIRHMYGLEGAKKSYTSVSCSKIQGTCNASSEGGCPFKSFDHKNMFDLLQTNTECHKDIIDLMSRKMYTSACILSLKNKAEVEICDNVSFSFTPVQYYLLASKLNPAKC